MALTPEEKQRRKRARMLEKAREYTTGTYVRKFVAPLFQRMIRAEWGAREGMAEVAVVDGKLQSVPRGIGQCVCVTCGCVKAWDSGIKGIHTGHFLASRRNSIIFEEDNVAPQCSSCNYYRSGAPQEFRLWMKWKESVREKDIIERLEKLKTTVRQFEREELVDMRISYQARLKAAEERMRGCRHTKT